MSSTGGRGRICLHVQFLYPVLAPDHVRYAGGLETQQAIVARGLKARGFDVHAVTFDFGQPDRLVLDGITLHRSFALGAGLPVVRFLHPRLTRTVRALGQADAEVYLMQGSGLLAGVTCDLAHARGAAFAFAAAHDGDVRRDLPLQTRFRERWWFRRALRQADLRITQTATQRQRLHADFGLDSVVVPNPIELPQQSFDAGRPGAVIWAATFKESKRPEWVIDLARRMPAQRVIMHGVVPLPPLTHAAWDRAREAARELPNLEVHDAPIHHRLDEVYRDAALFVHASTAEGFPNTFLEAWARGIPGVTAFDPDGVIGRRALGEVVGDHDAFVRAVERWLGDPEARRAAGARARAYVADQHEQGRVIDRIASLLDPLVERVRTARGHLRSARAE